MTICSKKKERSIVRVLLINYVSGVGYSYEFLIINFINFSIIKHRTSQKARDDRKNGVDEKSLAVTATCGEYKISFRADDKGGEVVKVVAWSEKFTLRTGLNGRKDVNRKKLKKSKKNFQVHIFFCNLQACTQRALCLRRISDRNEPSIDVIDGCACEITSSRKHSRAN